ncbi:hypothetical protein Celaphus_00002428 [Cervus elaphus hippelaphus]|uniref:Uncharacterized protein n=1 Tax=Cervus elaphus hippelaphus TaxID=46360 RepID=A0A212CH40_CEREH|nr:hypothetical protein Celaphus_00002428 [Cervus elaphus hippelaphus]
MMWSLEKFMRGRASHTAPQVLFSHAGTSPRAEKSRCCRGPQHWLHYPVLLPPQTNASAQDNTINLIPT